MSGTNGTLLHKMRTKFVEKPDRKLGKSVTRDDEPSGRERKSVKERRDTGSKRERRRKKLTATGEKREATSRNATQEDTARGGEDEPSQRRRARKGGEERSIRGRGKKKRRPSTPQATTGGQSTMCAPTNVKSSLPAAPLPPPDPHADVRGKWSSGIVEKGGRTAAKEFIEFNAAATMPAIGECSAFYETSNGANNRYKNVPCVEATRVKLLNGSYYHANYVGSLGNAKRFICAQSPMEQTAAAFWAMVVQEGIDSIIMLSALAERGRDLRKSAPHFSLQPNESTPSTFGTGVANGMRVATLEKSALPEEGVATSTPSIFVYTIKCSSMSSGKQQTTKIYHWNTWPERGVPEISMTPWTLMAAVRTSQRPILVHCSSGVGRSGSLVLFELLMDRMLVAPAENPLDVLKELRTQRCGAIQSDSQYLFTLRSLLHGMMTRHTIEMSQMLLEFVDEYDYCVKKATNEDKDKRDKRMGTGAKECDLASHLANEFGNNLTTSPGPEVSVIGI